MVSTKVTESITNELNIYLKIFCFLNADDTIVLAETAAQHRKALDGLNISCNKWALKVNLDKTKVIFFFFQKGKSENTKPLLLELIL